MFHLFNLNKCSFSTRGDHNQKFLIYYLASIISYTFTMINLLSKLNKSIHITLLYHFLNANVNTVFAT